MNINNSLKSIMNAGIDKTDAVTNNANSASTNKADTKNSTVSQTAISKSDSLKALESAIAASPAFDAARVDSIKMSIQDGSFTVDTAKVADGLIANAVGLIKP